MVSLTETSLKQRLRTFWDGQQVYWELLESHVATSAPLRHKMAAFVPDGARVLDLACGTCANSGFLGEHCRYFGVDVAIAGLKRASRELTLACGDAEQLPFASSTFDAVLATYVLEHSATPRAMLSQMLRVLRPGGRLLLLGPAWDFPFWYPNSLHTRAPNLGWRIRYTIGRLARQARGVLFGRLPFDTVADPDAFHTPFIYDSDAVYIVWTYEVIRFLARNGAKLIHWEADDKLLGKNAMVRGMKHALMTLPAYRRAGSTILMVFEK
ncbi:MAG: class I SAM-dependent methyltransferase [Candidatus Acidiferrales bacterium]